MKKNAKNIERKKKQAKKNSERQEEQASNTIKKIIK